MIDTKPYAQYQPASTRTPSGYEYRRATAPILYPGQLTAQVSYNTNTANNGAVVDIKVSGNTPTSNTQGRQYQRAGTVAQTQYTAKDPSATTNGYSRSNITSTQEATSPVNKYKTYQPFTSTNGIQTNSQRTDANGKQQTPTGNGETSKNPYLPYKSREPSGVQTQLIPGQQQPNKAASNLNYLTKYFGSSNKYLSSATTGIRTETDQSPYKIGVISPVSAGTPEKIKTGIRAVELLKSTEKIQKLKEIPTSYLDQQYLQVRRMSNSPSKLKLSGVSQKESVIIKEGVASQQSTFRKSPEKVHSPNEKLRKVVSSSNLVDAGTSKFERGALFQKRVEYDAAHAGAEGQNEVGLVTSQHLKLSHSGTNFFTSQVAGAHRVNVVTADQASELKKSICFTKQENELTNKVVPSVDFLSYQLVEETYADGTRYEGEKMLGKKHGRGRYYFKEGYIYDGNWENDQMAGYGVLWVEDRRKIYEGEWENSAFHGQGTLYNTELKKLDEFDGADFSRLRGGWLKFEGTFHKGMKKGMGTLLMTNGDVFVGNFLNDVVHGRGSYTHKNGRTYAGLWHVNKLIQRC